MKGCCVSRFHFLRGLIGRVLPFGLLPIALMLLPALAQADSFTTYSVTGTFASGGSLSGTFTLNGVTTVTQASLTADGLTFGCPSGNVSACIVYNSFGGYTEYSFLASTNPSQFIFLSWLIGSPTASFSFVTTPGDANGSYCAGCLPGGADFLVSGTAIDAPPVSTPELPTALLLLPVLVGIGFFGLRRTIVNA